MRTCGSGELCQGRGLGDCCATSCRANARALESFRLCGKQNSGYAWHLQGALSRAGRSLQAGSSGGDQQTLRATAVIFSSARSAPHIRTHREECYPCRKCRRSKCRYVPRLDWQLEREAARHNLTQAKRGRTATRSGAEHSSASHGGAHHRASARRLR